MADKPGPADTGMTTGRKAGLMAGVAGLSAVSTAAGVSAARALRHRKAVRDAYDGEDFALTRRGTRLSVMPVTAAQWKLLLSLE